MKAINIHEAKTNLSRIVEEVAAGEEIIVAKTKPRLHFQEAGFWFKVIIYFQLIDLPAYHFISLPAHHLTSSYLLKQTKHCLRQLVCLGQHGYACLLQNLGLGESCCFCCKVRIHNTGTSGGYVFRDVLQVGNG